VVGRENPATITVEHIRQAKEAWLIVFDRRDKSRSLPWEQRLSTRSMDQINVVTC